MFSNFHIYIIIIIIIIIIILLIILNNYYYITYFIKRQNELTIFMRICELITRIIYLLYIII